MIIVVEIASFGSSASNATDRTLLWEKRQEFSLPKDKAGELWEMIRIRDSERIALNYGDRIVYFESGKFQDSSYTPVKKPRRIHCVSDQQFLVDWEPNRLTLVDFADHKTREVETGYDLETSNYRLHRSGDRTSLLIVKNEVLELYSPFDAKKPILLRRPDVLDFKVRAFITADRTVYLGGSYHIQTEPNVFPIKPILIQYNLKTGALEEIKTKHNVAIEEVIISDDRKYFGTLSSRYLQVRRVQDVSHVVDYQQDGVENFFRFDPFSENVIIASQHIAPFWGDQWNTMEVVSLKGKGCVSKIKCKEPLLSFVFSRTGDKVVICSKSKLIVVPYEERQR
jgi:hypothetical protein